jgi:hypothetical protein
LEYAVTGEQLVGNEPFESAAGRFVNTRLLTSYRGPAGGCLSTHGRGYGRVDFRSQRPVAGSKPWFDNRFRYAPARDGPVVIARLGFPPLEPPAQRLLSLARSATRQETRDADIFIEIGPVDPLATSNKMPVDPLRRCPVRQTREPRERYGDRSAIRKVRDQSIIAYAYALGECSPEFSPRSAHAMTSTKRPRFSRPTFLSARISDRPKPRATNGWQPYPSVHGQQAHWRGLWGA